jgi:hypothetical protein
MNIIRHRYINSKGVEEMSCKAAATDFMPVDSLKSSAVPNGAALIKLFSNDYGATFQVAFFTEAKKYISTANLEGAEIALFLK